VPGDVAVRKARDFVLVIKILQKTCNGPVVVILAVALDQLAHNPICHNPTGIVVDVENRDEKGALKKLLGFVDVVPIAVVATAVKLVEKVALSVLNTPSPTPLAKFSKII
jgi:hypothetical protein